MNNRTNKRRIYAMYRASYIRLAAEERAWLDMSMRSLTEVYEAAERSLDAKNAVYEADDGPLTQETRDWLRSSAKGQMPKGKPTTKKTIR